MVGWSNFSIDPDQRVLCVEGTSKNEDETIQSRTKKFQLMSLEVSCDRPASGLTCIGQLNRERTRKEIMDVTFRRLISRLSLDSNCSSRKSLTAKISVLKWILKRRNASASVLTQCDNYLGAKFRAGWAIWSGKLAKIPAIDSIWEISTHQRRWFNENWDESRPGNTFQHE